MCLAQFLGYTKYSINASLCSRHRWFPWKCLFSGCPWGWSFRLLFFFFFFFFQCENFPILSTGKLPTFPHTDLYEMTSSFFYLNHCTLTIFAVPKGLMLFSSAKSQIIYIWKQVVADVSTRWLEHKIKGAAFSSTPGLLKPPSQCSFRCCSLFLKWQ